MTYTWTIDNFSKLKTRKHYSDGFVVGDFKWRIAVYPKGSNGRQFLSMYLNVADASKLPSRWSRYAEFTLTVVNQFNSDKSITIERCYYLISACYKAATAQREVQQSYYCPIVSSTMMLLPDWEFNNVATAQLGVHNAATARLGVHNAATS
ncbi:hypothetical protein ACLB2K_072903 [Fragaria x ananassa]